MASLLIRNVTYEGPALRRQLAKAQQLQQELSRREVECQSSAADMRQRYYAACKQYGISVSTGTVKTKKKLALRMCTILSSFLSEWIEMIPPESISLNNLHSFFFFCFTGRQCDSRASGSGQRLTCGS